MILPTPDAPFEMLNTNGEPITIDVNAKFLVIPSKNQTLPMYNEHVLNTCRPKISNGMHVFTYDFNEETGLKNVSAPWIALYDPDSDHINYFLFTHHMKELSYKINDQGVISELTLYPGNGSIYHGQIRYPKYQPIPEKKVYGWWYTNTSPLTFQPRWEFLAQVIFGFWLTNSDGTLSPPSKYTNFTGVQEGAASHNVDLIIGIAGGLTDVNTILANNSVTFANNVLAVLQLTGAKGINMDFEDVGITNSINGASNYTLFENLLSTIHSVLKNANPDYHISYCVSNKIDEIHRNSNLAQYVDSIFLMGYPYYWQSAQFAGPIAPMGDPTRSDISSTLEILAQWYPNEKIIVGIAFYGYDWPVISSDIGCPTTGAGTKILVSGFGTKDSIPNRMWDPNSHCPWYRYQSDGVWHQVWYEDVDSVAYKYKQVKLKNYLGLGVWEMGFAGNVQEIWDAFLAPVNDIPDGLNISYKGSVPSFLSSHSFSDMIKGISKYLTSNNLGFRTADLEYYMVSDS